MREKKVELEITLAKRRDSREEYLVKLEREKVLTVHYPGLGKLL